MERLQRILAARGVASRRKAEELITAGRVSVDGEVVTELGSKADPVRSSIRVDGKLLKAQTPRYILLNKPRGYITTMKDERDRWTVMDLVQIKERVYPVGRLDRETEGLLLLTNDGDVANRVTHPRYELEKEYHVVTSTRPPETTMQRVRVGLTIDGKKVIPSEFRIYRETREGLVLTITIHEGITHVIRKIMEAARIPVERLRRVRVGPLGLTGLPLGAWRDLTAGERGTLFEAIGLSADAGPAPGDSRREPAPVIHMTRRPTRTRQPAAQPIEERPPANAPAARPQRIERGAKTDEATPSSPRSRRRKGEPPAPLPKKPRVDRSVNKQNDDRNRNAKPKRSSRGEHDQRDRGRNGQPARNAKPRTPSSGRNRRPSGGRQDNGSKPRRQAPRRDAV